MSHTLEKPEDLQQWKASLIVLNFWADWCEPSVQLNPVVDQLAGSYSNLKFVKVDAEKHSDVSERFKVTSVPSYVFVKEGKIIDRVEGANAAELAQKLEKYKNEVPAPSAPTENKGQTLEDRLKALTTQASVMLFMKGQPSAPQCGFSRKIVDILNKNNITFGSFDILKDEEVRQGLKNYSNWPTYPQLYSNGKLVGGLDVIKDLDEEGELADALAQ
eukprot:TRINITY_DN1708_c0_g1_i1.p1 TRINITY_DN1708_c0_g1~~TRINITY_DN1708_c0_g1_i1.p1  ORF type:complete len:217 (-),score=48.58 TRINITY_DN1708_c0_g1_i1:89-739(-)